MSRWRFAPVWLALLIAQATPGMTKEAILLLNVELNGADTGVVVETIERQGALFAAPAELRDAGLKVPATTQDLVALGSLAGVSARVDGPRQVLVVTADAAALQPHLLSGQRFGALPPITAPGWGALLNYDALATGSGSGNGGDSGGDSGGIVPELRLFGPYGTLSTSAIASFGTLRPEQSGLVRLDTYYSYAETSGLRDWRAGDLITGGLAWSRPIRLGGVQVATDLDMRPDLIRYATPDFVGQAVVPSTVDVLVDGARQLSASVPAGPFEIPSVPVVTGAGDVEVAIRDALGRQTFVTLPFYASTQLLAAGLTEYSAEAGAIRFGYATPQSTYAGWTTSATIQHGLADWLTLSAHAEATAGLGLAGGGGAVRLGGLGIASLDVAASGGDGPRPACLASPPPLVAPNRCRGPGAGGLVSVGVQHSTRHYDVSAAWTLATSGYRDVATTTGVPYPLHMARIGVGAAFGRFGHLGVAWVNQGGTSRGGGTFAAADEPAYAGSSEAPGLAYLRSVSLLNVNYDLPLTARIGFMATAYRDLHDPRSTGLFAGLSWALGGRNAATASLDTERASTTADLQFQRAAYDPGDIGIALDDQEGAERRHDAELEYLSTIGTATVAGEQAPSGTSWRVGASGSVVLAGGGLFLANRIDDSFAVVRTGDLAGVPVLYENRPVGSTDDDGRLLVPYLRSYDANRIAIDPLALPVDVEADSTERIVRPVNSAGVVVDFGVRRSNGAIVRLQLPGGGPVPRGAFARAGTGPQVPVGRDGRTYLTGLAADNDITVQLPDQSLCHARVAFRPVPGDIPLLGPVTCH